jgi:hypothetical protein
MGNTFYAKGKPYRRPKLTIEQKALRKIIDDFHQKGSQFFFPSAPANGLQCGDGSATG